LQVLGHIFLCERNNTMKDTYIKLTNIDNGNYREFEDDYSLKYDYKKDRLKFTIISEEHYDNLIALRRSDDFDKENEQAEKDFLRDKNFEGIIYTQTETGELDEYRVTIEQKTFKHKLKDALRERNINYNIASTETFYIKLNEPPEKWEDKEDIRISDHDANLPTRHNPHIEIDISKITDIDLFADKLDDFLNYDKDNAIDNYVIEDYAKGGKIDYFNGILEFLNV